MSSSVEDFKARFAGKRVDFVGMFFTDKDVARINRTMNAGPDQQMKRIMRLEAKKAEIRALDALAA